MRRDNFNRREQNQLEKKKQQHTSRKAFAGTLHASLPRLLALSTAGPTTPAEAGDPVATVSVLIVRGPNIPSTTLCATASPVPTPNPTKRKRKQTQFSMT